MGKYLPIILGGLVTIYLWLICLLTRGSRINYNIGGRDANRAHQKRAYLKNLRPFFVESGYCLQ